MAQIIGKNPTLVQGDVIQESATLGTALRSSGASEVMLFVRLLNWVSQFKSRWSNTIEPASGHLGLPHVRLFRISNN